MSASAAVRIVPATERDVPVILELIRSLADYERLSHEVVATQDGLKDSPFGARAAAEVAIAYLDDEPAGFAGVAVNSATASAVRSN